MASKVGSGLFCGRFWTSEFRGLAGNPQASIQKAVRTGGLKPGKEIGAGRRDSEDTGASITAVTVGEEEAAQGRQTAQQKGTKDSAQTSGRGGDGRGRGWEKSSFQMLNWLTFVQDKS